MSAWWWLGAAPVALAASAAAGAWVVDRLLARVAPGGDAGGLLSGGRWIGVLERLAVTGAIMAGVPEGVAVVIAIKGLGRYPELRGGDGRDGSGVAERFIIGTLASFFWAALWGVGARWLVGAVS